MKALSIKSIISTLHKQYEKLQNGIIIKRTFKFKLASFHMVLGKKLSYLFQDDFFTNEDFDEEKFWEAANLKIPQEKFNKKVEKFLRDCDKYAKYFNIEQDEFFHCVAENNSDIIISIQNEKPLIVRRKTGNKKSHNKGETTCQEK